MEDEPLFNAGRGAVFTDNGTGVGTFTWTPAIGPNCWIPSKPTARASIRWSCRCRCCGIIFAAIRTPGSASRCICSPTRAS